MNDLEAAKIGVIGLGYVGLPLAVELGKHFDTLGFDVSKSRIEEVRSHSDRTREVTEEEFSKATALSFANEITALKDRNVYIVTVPTPIDSCNIPDLGPLRSASELVGRVLSFGDLVIYESTVYPGATEEVCVPILSHFSGLTYNVGFYCGYSPERINPGDKERRLTSIKKVTSGSSSEAADFVDRIYRTIISAGTHKAPSIKVAEAAKVIENTQRDINIALMNELALIFEKLNIDTRAVLDAAETKWNFLPFKPGLVGGHCIGVDPYYLTHKCSEVGYHPEIILAGRRINDSMPVIISSKIMKLMIEKKIHLSDANVVLLGATFKPNCPDLRNSKALELAEAFIDYGANVEIYDPWVADLNGYSKSGLTLVNGLERGRYDLVVLAVAHEEIINMPHEVIMMACKPKHVVYDLHGVLPFGIADARL